LKNKMRLTDAIKQKEAEASKPQLAVAVNVFKESPRQIEECFKRISNNLPDAIVGIFLDGVDRPEIIRLARKFGFLPMIGNNYGVNATWNLWWLRMLYFFEWSNASVCFKFDPDTMVDAKPLTIPNSHYFGDVPDGIPYVQGGVTGLSIETVRTILDKKLLEPIKNEPRPWLALKNSEFADDQALGCMLRYINIFPIHWPECKSVWRISVYNNPVTHAIVHPRYYNDTMGKEKDSAHVDN
jgi:hypothetical protein